ncbi:hypothetical protein QYE76_068288 [Lolium multiflorum]|uniref:BZIP domain-containing protein n=1 Tax=Lolium multiflorum TaxID=4521 RepID=A0AAD8SF82_LOLMU|nr:hypothetical protein QYE76_068288 [Lolium multiflorum]
MGAQAAMPSSGGAISRQGSLCSLTLSDVEGQLHGLRAAAGSRRTVDEVWRDIQGAAGSCARPQPAQMTLEDFLSRSGGGSAVDAADAGGGGGGGGWAAEQYNPPPPVPEQQQRHSIGRPLPRPLGVGAGPVLLDALYHDHHDVAAAMSGRKRAAAASAAGGPVEKTVERRKKRMIKNRESAARSRARKQAYTNELENKISLLEEENERLRNHKAFESEVQYVPQQEPTNQLRRRNSASF